MEFLPGTLEEDSRFHGFTDLVTNIPLVRGQTKDSTTVGEFKGTFRIYPIEDDLDCPRILSGFPSPSPKEITTRIYVISASDLAPKDHGSSSDPYVVIKLNRKQIDGKDHYKKATLNPIFGQVYEIKGILPVSKDLIVQVWDRDALSSDDLIGETKIDLENRFLTRHRATIGLAKQYHV